MPFLGGISLKLNTFMLLSNIQSAIASFQDHMLVIWIYNSPKVWCDMGKFFQVSLSVGEFKLVDIVD
jgi:hypothetical protein